MKSKTVVMQMIILMLAVLGFAGIQNQVFAVANSRPLNIVLITADDLGLQVGCYGDAQAKTPNIDRLASEGIRFTKAYVTASTCSSSRASILTGLYPTQNGQTWLANCGGKLKTGMPKLPNLLKKADYRTAILGKLHLGTVPGEEFEFDVEWASRINPERTRDVRDMARRADAFIKESGTEPFFLYANYFDPHDDGFRPDPNLRYGPQLNQIKGLPEKVLKPGEVKTLSFFGIDKPPIIASDMACYYNCIHRLDAGIGMLMDVLRKNGVEDNTLVIFLSDNGPEFMRGKTTCYAAGVHVPFIVRWPGVVEPGRTSDALISGVDITPTLLEAACVNTDETSRMSGMSILPILRGAAETIRKTLAVEFTSHDVWHYYPRRGIIDDKYLYILNILSGQRNPCVLRGWAMPPEGHPMREAHMRVINPPPVEFFNISKDPDCLNNLASNPEYGQQMKALANALQDWRKKSDDPLLVDGGLDRETAQFRELLKTNE